MNQDRINELYYGEIFDIETQRLAKERIHWICEQVEGDKILDIGCSQGIVCILLARENFSCIGLDLEKQSIEFAKNELEKEEEIVKNRISFIVGDAMNLEYSDNSFDTVILGEILEHLTHPEKVLIEAKRVLKEDGKIIITIPFGLNSHPDHKRSYFPTSFLEIVHPFFMTTYIDTTKNNIIYTGMKTKNYHPVLNKELFFNQILSLQKKVEERCVEQELKSDAAFKKLLEQNKNSNDIITSLKENNINLQKKMKEEQEKNNLLFEENNSLLIKEEEYQERINLQEKIIDQLQSEENELQEIMFERDKFQKKLAELELKIFEHEKNIENARLYQEKVMKNSSRWRIGSIFVGGGKIIFDIIFHPLNFLKEAKPRFKNFYSEIFPSHSDLKKKR
ncbi:MAG: hypothetical protein CVU41_01005 [Chloroflexi bacterium HGW-Chloroflexi-3]|nr:MAG: hypothetical protein CVU41_01005 [Chloroflexi bacterium HGW-Chloroflexi-3]